MRCLSDIIHLKNQPPNLREKRCSKSLRLYYKGKRDLHIYSQRQTNQVLKIAFSSAFFSKNHVHVRSVGYFGWTVRKSCGRLPFSFQIYDPKHSCCWYSKRNSWKELKHLSQTEFGIVSSTKEWIMQFHA